MLLQLNPKKTAIPLILSYKLVHKSIIIAEADNGLKVDEYFGFCLFFKHLFWALFV